MKKVLPKNARSKVERSQHGFAREAWMGLHHLLDGFARRELFEKEFDRDARAGYDRLSHHDAGIGLNGCHRFTFCATWNDDLKPAAADTFLFRRPRLRRLAIASKQAEEVLSGFFADGTTIRIDLAEDASGLTFETVAEEETVES